MIVGVNTIDAPMLRRMFLTGAKNLELKKDYINELNVFPVPDGDTGTNMTLTIMSAADAVSKLPEGSMDAIAKAISSGSLRGARGNSGVILSQLFRGFTKQIRDCEKLDAKVIAAASQRAVETAYKAVMKPKEGTILTVAKGMAAEANLACEETEDLKEFFDRVVKAGEKSLASTPELLPVLKEAGVVDSGGSGLMAVVEGAVDAFNGKELDLSFEKPGTAEHADKTSETGHKEISTDKIKYGYCTEFIINLEKPFTQDDEKKMKDFLTSIGDSLVLVADDQMVKVHVHTNHPGLAFEKALEYGSLDRMKIDNMRIEHQEKLFKESEKNAAAAAAREPEKTEPKKKVGFISVTIGEGLSEIFRGLGVDYLIEGGQTMNPSTDDMLNAIAKVNAENVFIFPNNKNVILAANQAQELVKDCRVYVVPTKTIPQGITAMINYVPERSADENFETMKDEIGGVKTGEVTYAVRDTKIDGKVIHSGDIMGIGDEGIMSVGTDIKEVVLDMLGRMIDDDTELVSIYNGADFSNEDTEDLTQKISEKYPTVDVENNYGGQPIYYCILSVE